MHRPSSRSPIHEYLLKVWIAAGIAALTIAVLAALWFGLGVLLIIFAGVLLGLFLLDPAQWLSQHTFLSRRWAMVFVILALILILSGLGATMASSLNSQFRQLMEALPDSIGELESQLQHWPLGEMLAQRLEQSQTGGNLLSNWFARISSVLTSTLGIVTNLLFVVFVAFFFAFDPELYRQGLLRLVPPRRRPLVGELLGLIRHKLNWWILGRLLSMTLIGILTGLGLWLLGMPTYLTLALLAALLVFIPYLGPLLAAIPALLVASSEGMVWQVAVLYLLIQGVESNLVTPLIDRQSVRLAPAVLLSAQVSLGLLAGMPGLLMAAPLTVVIMVIVKRIYVEGWLEAEAR